MALVGIAALPVVSGTLSWAAMYYGPLKWPTRAIWIGALALTMTFVVFGAFGWDARPLFVAALVLVLLIAAPRRAKEWEEKGSELCDSRPPEDPKRH